MENWGMLMEHIDEIKTVEGLQDNNKEEISGRCKGHGLPSVNKMIVSISSVKCIEVKAPEYYPSGEGEESKTEAKEGLVEKVKKYKWVIINSVGLVLGGLGAKKLYDDYMIKNYYVDHTYIRDHKISLEEKSIILGMDMYFQQELEKGNIEEQRMNGDSKYFIYIKKEAEETNYYKVMPRDYRGRIIKEIEFIKKEGGLIAIDKKFMLSVVPKIVVENQRRIDRTEYLYLEKCLMRNMEKNRQVREFEKKYLRRKVQK